MERVFMCDYRIGIRELNAGSVEKMGEEGGGKDAARLENIDAR
jgi:hypothetical protein